MRVEVTLIHYQMLAYLIVFAKRNLSVLAKEQIKDIIVQKLKNACAEIQLVMLIPIATQPVRMPL